MFIDRFARRPAILVIYLGFLLGTLACGLSTSFAMLLAAGSLTGVFGNEIPAGPELLRTVSLEERIVTADAIHCQRETCQQIRDRGGHDLLVVKDNQHELYETLQAEFQVAFSPSDRAAATS
jgi:hypothetical protein